VSLVGGVEFFHDFFHFFFGGFFYAHFFGSEDQYFFELVALNAVVAVDVDHFECCFVDAVHFLFVADQLLPHYSNLL
jgi:hypothetical protein